MTRVVNVSVESGGIPAVAPTPTPDGVCAIIVTYNPDAGFRGRVPGVIAQFGRTLIVDNGSGPDARDMLERLALDERVELLSNASNLGIARALNQGIARALQNGFSWCVTLDQDTVVFPDMLETLIKVNTDSGIERVLVGGNYRNVNKQRNFIDCGGSMDGGYRVRKTLITAGTLIPLEMAIWLGGFRDDYFIDSVDHEFCLRARANGFRILITCKPVMSQSIGSNIETDSRLSRFASFNHSPVRKYYIARNTLVTARNYCFLEPSWAMRQMWRLLSDFISILLFESEKPAKAKAFVLGLLDGLANRMGQLDASRLGNRKENI